MRDRAKWDAWKAVEGTKKEHFSFNCAVKIAR